jgi:hypothetical protein
MDERYKDRTISTQVNTIGAAILVQIAIKWVIIFLIAWMALPYLDRWVLAAINAN